MKKLIMAIVAVSCLSVSLTGCPSPADSAKDALGRAIGGNNPGGIGLGTGAGDCSTILQCLVSKDPTNAAEYQKSLEQIKSLSPQFQAQICGLYDSIVKTYGCGK